MRNIAKLVEALGIPDPGRVVPPMEGLEAAFRPLVKTIPHDVEPAVTLRSLTAEAAEE